MLDTNDNSANSAFKAIPAKSFLSENQILITELKRENLKLLKEINKLDRILNILREKVEPNDKGTDMLIFNAN